MAGQKKFSQALLSLEKPAKKSLIDKGFDLISAPQRMFLKKAANVLGAKGDSTDSEKSSQAIVEKVAEKLGVPEDSTLGNAAKALGVAGLEVFGDPLGPLSKVGKIGKMAAKGSKLPDLQKLNKLRDAVLTNKLKLSQDTMKKLENTIKVVKPQTIDQALPEKFKRVNMGIVTKIEKPETLGKVEMKVRELDPGMVKMSEVSKTPSKTIIVKKDGNEIIENSSSISSDSEEFFKRALKPKKK